MLSKAWHRSPRRQAGLSLIEMMVGLTVGLIVVGGAIMLTVNQLGEHRRLLLETQIQQDLRATSDMMLRDLRRAGYWGRPETGVWAPAAAAPASHNYATLTANGNSQLEYSYSQSSYRSSNTPSVVENNVVDAATEAFGFKLENRVLKFKLGQSWQPLTDENVMWITAFTITPVVQTVGLADACEVPCLDGSNLCLRQQIRYIRISLTGQARHDPAVQRRVDVSARVRNDLIEGACGT